MATFMHHRFLLSILLAAVLLPMPSCAPLTPEQIAARQKRQQEETARREHNRVAYHRIQIIAPSYELRELATVELAAKGFDVVGGNTPWNLDTRSSEASPAAHGAVAVVRITDSRPAWVTHDSYPTYTLSEHQARPAFKTQLEVVVNSAQGRHLHTYFGTSRAPESWNRRESERSALRAALQFFPQNDELTW